MQGHVNGIKTKPLLSSWNIFSKDKTLNRIANDAKHRTRDNMNANSLIKRKHILLVRALGATNLGGSSEKPGGQGIHINCMNFIKLSKKKKYKKSSTH